MSGARGFIASALVERLVADGARVRKVLRYTSPAESGWLDDLPTDVLDNLDVTFEDVLDVDAIREVW